MATSMIFVPEPRQPEPAGRCPFTGAAEGSPFPVTSPLHWPDADQVADEAREFLLLMEREGVISAQERAARVTEVTRWVNRTGVYWHTPQELEHGAKVAWRNSSRCIGRLYWQKLIVRDQRHLSDAEEIFDSLVEHIRTATNGGKLQSTISVFAPPVPGTGGIRIWNPQLIRYAGYRQHDGTVIGDPLQVEFTEIVRKLGWDGGDETPFDLLPIVIQVPGEPPRLFEIPRDAVLEVEIEHPDFPWFRELGLKWHALPVISSMRMEIGGVSYPAAPFNGWYMGTEIGARNFGDADRYNMLPVVAREMGLNMRSNRQLWRDRALVELNVAVLHSFQEAGVTVIDHHTASKHFVRHEEFERQADRPVPAEWSWIVPPISGSATEVFHREYHDTLLRPNYFYQPNAWETTFPSRSTLQRQVDSAQEERDGLTGLMHRGALDRRLQVLGRDGGVIALIDLDDFPSVGEEHGHLAANALLRSAGRTVLGSVRPDDHAARFGTHTFCLVLPSVETAAAALLVAERVRGALGEISVSEAPSVRLEASIGIAFFCAGDDMMAALDRAREALREARQSDGERIVIDEWHERSETPPHTGNRAFGSNGRGGLTGGLRGRLLRLLGMR